MDNRFQHILLKLKPVTVAILCLLSSVLFAVEKEPSGSGMSNINNEVFDLGVHLGIVNFEDFSSELTPGLSATFRASEDYFIQYNYIRTNVSLSSYEKSQGSLLPAKTNRRFVHYDLLVGYNLFQGEFFTSATKAGLSTLYIVAGVGTTKFGGESNFTYTFGAGYDIALSRHFSINFDFRDYIYKSDLIYAKETSVTNAHISTGLRYSF
jgi:outer membrane beta-barrel protein